MLKWERTEKENQTIILTYDFVHRSHIDIFGYYYPRVFPGWHSDRWINDVYLPNRTKKLNDIMVKHIEEQGRRYDKHRFDIPTIQRVIVSEKKLHLKP